MHETLSILSQGTAALTFFFKVRRDLTPNELKIHFVMLLKGPFEHWETIRVPDGSFYCSVPITRTKLSFSCLFKIVTH